MKSALIILLCFVLAFGAYPQSETEESSHKRSVYFLIDASGTMRDWRDDAIATLNAKKTLLPPDTQTSVSFFGQEPLSPEEVVDCDDVIQISPLGPRTNATTSFPKLGRDQDTTAIGQALLAALLAGGDDAHVVLITDGNDECASDFVAIRRMNPRAKIDVYQVGGDPNTALELLELSSLSIMASNTVEMPNPVIVDFPKTDSEWETAEPLARWNWLIGIGIMLLSVIGFGIQQGLRAHSLEGELKSLRDEKRKTQDGKLDVGVSEIHLQRALEKLKKYGSAWVPIGFFLFGIAWIGVLAFGPDSHFQVSRQMAWLVLSSSFAIVFSVFTSTPIFFATSQYWRSMQIKRTFDDEVDATKVAELQQQRAENARAYRSYKDLRKIVEHSKFSSPWPTGAMLDRSSEDKEAFGVVADEAQQIAISKLLPEGDPSKVLKEIERLDRYKVDWPTRASLSAWIRLFEEDKLIASNSWLKLASSIESGELESIKASFILLRDELQSREQ